MGDFLISKDIIFTVEPKSDAGVCKAIGEQSVMLPLSESEMDFFDRILDHGEIAPCISTDGNRRDMREKEK